MGAMGTGTHPMGEAQASPSQKLNFGTELISVQACGHEIGAGRHSIGAIAPSCVAACTQVLTAVSDGINEKRAKRGLQARPVRACVIGFPNIGKSAIINRLLGRRAVASAAKPGVTRALQVRMGGFYTRGHTGAECAFGGMCGVQGALGGVCGGGHWAGSQTGRWGRGR